MLTPIDRFLVLFAAALITYTLTHFIYRKTSTAFWAYVSVWFLEVPVFIVTITGAQELEGFDIFIHTLGIPVMSMILMIADIFIVELAMIGMIRPLKSVLPKEMASIIGLYDALKIAHKYRAIPRPERVGRVFIVSVLGGLVSFACLLLAGAFA